MTAQESSKRRRTRDRIRDALRLLSSGTHHLEDIRNRSDRDHAATLEVLARLDQLARRHEVTEGRLSQLDAAGSQVAQQLAELAQLHAVLRQERLELDAALATLALQQAGHDAPAVPADGPLVSVVLPTWQRAGQIGTAVRSVQAQTYPRWELVVVDDGSTDGTEAVVKPLCADDRIRYEHIAHAGVAAARNHGLAVTTGEIVAYLDSDNVWHPAHLGRHVEALLSAPEAVWSISEQLVVDASTGAARIRNTHWDLHRLWRDNFIDLNTLAHRRSVLADIGGFDEALDRLVDWDLVLRLASVGTPARTFAVTSTYRLDAPERISDRASLHVNAHTIRARHRGRPADGLRVLLAEWHYPQVTETYIEALVQGLLRLGAEVDVWAQDRVSVPYPASVPVHRGELRAAIAQRQPDVVVTHWLQKGEELRAITRAAGVPHVVRTHGFDHDPAVIERLLRDEGVLVHTYPHLLEPGWGDHPHVHATVSCFDDERYRPSTEKDTRLVVRTAAGLFTKDLDTFLLAANACPEHRFVLVLGHALLVEERTEAIIERAHRLESRCEILVDLQHDEVADVISSAGVYLHTHGTDHPVTMPISICEAMATGSWILARDLPGMAAYVGDAGALYSGDTPEARAAAAADLVRGSLSWSDERWAETAFRSAERAFARHACRDVVSDMVEAWRQAFRLSATASR